MQQSVVCVPQQGAGRAPGAGRAARGGRAALRRRARPGPAGLPARRPRQRAGGLLA